ncbi:response regulator transcription factor [Pedobacter sp. UBA4863]|uniref:response regulator n=1 Tax=Pedobacter sp. UBA4863 TaxID=1947060 RepID=UPI0025FA6671|nr:response regulator transcription factor [Pedobacter sp. UBA4863]
MLKIAIVEDNIFLQRAIREKLSMDPNLTIKLCASNGVEALEKLASNRVDLILMDIEMPKMNGIETVLAVKTTYPLVKVIMLTVFDNDENIFKAVKAGADGYFLKDVSPEELCKGITETMQGGAAMTPSIAAKTLKLLRDPDAFKHIQEHQDFALTTREVEVLELLSKGLKYSAIADTLFLSVSTIRKHIENIYGKLQVHNKLEAIQKAKNNGIF